jgi:hypothetical protein
VLFKGGDCEGADGGGGAHAGTRAAAAELAQEAYAPGHWAGRTELAGVGPRAEPPGARSRATAEPARGGRRREPARGVARPRPAEGACSRTAPVDPSCGGRWIPRAAAGGGSPVAAGAGSPNAPSALLAIDRGLKKIRFVKNKKKKKRSESATGGVH